MKIAAFNRGECVRFNRDFEDGVAVADAGDVGTVQKVLRDGTVVVDLPSTGEGFLPGGEGTYYINVGPAFLDVLEAEKSLSANMKRKGLELWEKAPNYMGEHYDDYYVGPGRSRDSDALEESNFEAALEMLGGESEPEVIVARSSHWAVGWVEQILVHKDAADKVKILEGIEQTEEANGGVLDDDLYFQKQDEEYQAQWDSWARNDAITMLGLEEMEEQGEIAGQPVEQAIYRAVMDTFSDYGEATLKQETLERYFQEHMKELNIKLDPELGFMPAEDPRQQRLFNRVRALDAMNRTSAPKNNLYDIGVGILEQHMDMGEPLFKPGDKVKVEMSPYDLSKGRISFRYK